MIGLRGIGYPCSSDPWARRFGDMLVPALCPGHASQLTLPSTGRLPSTVSAADVTRHCSRLHRYYAVVQLLTRVHAHRSAVAFMGRSDVPPDTDEVSQVPTKGRLHVHGVFDCARLLVRKPVPRGGCCFPANCTASAPRNSTRFAAQYPARGLPCERFELALAGSPRITGGRLARPYPVEDLHLLSFASLSWRSQFWVKSTRSRHLAATGKVPPIHADGRKGGRPSPEAWIDALDALKAALVPCKTVRRGTSMCEARNNAPGARSSSQRAPSCSAASSRSQLLPLPIWRPCGRATWPWSSRGRHGRCRGRRIG